MKKAIVFLTIALLLLSGCSSNNEPGDNKVPPTGDKVPDTGKSDPVKQEASLKQALESMSNDNMDVVMVNNLGEADGNSDTKMQIRNAGKDSMEMKSTTTLGDMTINYYIKGNTIYAEMNGMKFILPSTEDFDIFDTTEDYNSDAFENIDFAQYKVSETGNSYLYTTDFGEDNPFGEETGEGNIVIEVDKKSSKVISTVVESTYEGIQSKITITYDNLGPIEFPDFSEFTEFPS